MKMGRSSTVRWGAPGVRYEQMFAPPTTEEIAAVEAAVLDVVRRLDPDSVPS